MTHCAHSYNAAHLRDLLMQLKLDDVRPLINVCNRGGFVPDLLHFFVAEGQHQFIEVYASQVAAGNMPLPADAITAAIEVLANYESASHIGFLSAPQHYRNAVQHLQAALRAK